MLHPSEEDAFVVLHLPDPPIGGDRASTHGGVLALLHAAYDKDLGIYEIALHYTTGRGYRVVSATRRSIPGGSYKPGDKVRQPAPPSDIAAEVKARLHEGGVQVQE
jgi:hypothetical protein